MTELERHRPDRGFTVVEISMVVALLGIVSAVVVFTMRGVSGPDSDGACAREAGMLTTAADTHMTRQGVVELTALGASDNRYELFFVDIGVIEQISTHFDLRVDGTVVSTGTPC